MPCRKVLALAFCAVAAEEACHQAAQTSGNDAASLLQVAGAKLQRQEQRKHPEGPSQQCSDDAGPPWADDPATPAYFEAFPNAPVLVDGACAAPLRSACSTKSPLAAYLDGPVDCGGKGWFCRIRDQPGHRAPGFGSGTPPSFPDSNYAECKEDETDHDRSGHCHGSDHDDVYGWWVRDHWFRNYAGTLKCCCDFYNGTLGVVNRCDYRKKVPPESVDDCRDANEEHTVDHHPNCAGYEAREPPADTCWELTSFGLGPNDFEDPWPSPGPTPTPPAPTPPAPTPPAPTPPAPTPPAPSPPSPSPSPSPPSTPECDMEELGDNVRFRATGQSQRIKTQVYALEEEEALWQCGEDCLTMDICGGVSARRFGKTTKCEFWKINTENIDAVTKGGKRWSSYHKECGDGDDEDDEGGEDDEDDEDADADDEDADADEDGAQGSAVILMTRRRRTD